MGALVVAAFGLRVLWTGSWPLWDLDIYVEGARAVLNRQDIYQAEVHGKFFTYPTFAAAVFVPLVWLGSAAPWLAGFLSFASFAAVVLVLGRRLRLDRGELFVVAVGGLALEPVVRTFVLGQVNLVLLALIVLDVFAVPSRFRGVMVGVAAGVKLTPAVFVVYFLLRRDFRSASRAAGSFGMTVIVGWFIAPESSLAYWTHHVFGMDTFGDYELQPSNQSLRATLVRAVHDMHPSVMWWLPVLLLTFGLGIAVARRRLRAGDDVGGVLAVALTGLLVSPVSWTHHWVWVVPALAYAVATGHRVLAILSGGLFLVAPMWFLPNGEGDVLRYAPWQVLVSVTYVLLAAFGLAALAARRTSTRVLP